MLPVGLITTGDMDVSTRKVLALPPRAKAPRTTPTIPSTQCSPNEEVDAPDAKEQKLPHDILIEIGCILQAQHADHSLSSLAQADKHLNQKLTPKLYDTVRLDTTTSIQNFFQYFTPAAVSLRSKKWKYKHIPKPSAKTTCDSSPGHVCNPGSRTPPTEEQRSVNIHYGRRRRYLSTLINHLELKISNELFKEPQSWVKAIRQKWNSADKRLYKKDSNLILLKTLYCEITDSCACVLSMSPWLSYTSGTIEHHMMRLFYPQNLCIAVRLQNPRWDRRADMIPTAGDIISSIFGETCGRHGSPTTQETRQEERQTQENSGGTAGSQASNDDQNGQAKGSVGDVGYWARSFEVCCLEDHIRALATAMPGPPIHKHTTLLPGKSIYWSCLDTYTPVLNSLDSVQDPNSRSLIYLSPDAKWRDSPPPAAYDQLAFRLRAHQKLLQINLLINKKAPWNGPSGWRNWVSQTSSANAEVREGYKAPGTWEDWSNAKKETFQKRVQDRIDYLARTGDSDTYGLDMFDYQDLTLLTGSEVPRRVDRRRGDDE